MLRGGGRRASPSPAGDIRGAHRGIFVMYREHILIISQMILGISRGYSLYFADILLVYLKYSEYFLNILNILHILHVS